MFTKPYSRNTGRCSHAPELKIRKGQRQQVLQLIRSRWQTVKPSCPLQITHDPDDDIFPECADAPRADYQMTGSPKYFPKFWKKTKVIASREFLSIVAPHLIP